MLLIDLSQIFHSNIPFCYDENEVFNKDLFRLMVFKSILKNKKNFKDYGEIILCCDDGNCWRKDIFPNYKFKRKKDREKWQPIYDTITTIENDVKKYFPFKLLKVPRCEGDDIIAVITKKFGVFKGAEPKIMILSCDKDLLQLQYFSNVEQYDLIRNKMLTVNNAAAFLQEHIIRGDHTDGIPNIKSPDDIFLTEGTRQASIRNSEVNEWIIMNYEDFCDTHDMKVNYERNRAMIDFNMIPSKYVDEINYMIDSEIVTATSKIKLRDYFINNRLPSLMGRVDEFFN